MIGREISVGGGDGDADHRERERDVEGADMVTGVAVELVAEMQRRKYIGDGWVAQMALLCKQKTP